MLEEGRSVGSQKQERIVTSRVGPGVRRGWDVTVLEDRKWMYRDSSPSLWVDVETRDRSQWTYTLSDPGPTSPSCTLLEGARLVGGHR